MIPKMYCLYCRELGERKQIAASHFRKVGLDVDFFEGIHGKTYGLKSSIICNVDGKNKEWYISAGHLGLNLGHRMVWEHVMHTDMQEVIIFEDDARPTAMFEMQYNRCRRNLPDDWEICYLGWIDSHPRELQRVGDCVHRMKLRSGVPFGTHAMLLNRRGIQKLLDHTRVCNMHIDVLLAKHVLPKSNFYVCYPSLVRQESQEGKMKPSV